MNRIVARLSFAALAIAAIAAPMSAQTAPPERWIVPVVGSTAGANGAQFRTSMQLHNPSDAPAAGAIVFHPMGVAGSGVDPAIRYALAPYETVEYDDVVAAVGRSGLGSLDVIADSGTTLPTMTVRAFNILPTLGTLGSSVPVVHPDDALGRGDAVIVVSPANIQRYRLNIGIRTLEGPVVFRATIFNEAGVQRGEPFERTFAPEYFEQRAAADFLGVALQANDSVIFEILSGRAFIYGSTTDNRTNDPNIQIDRLFGRSILADSQTVTTPEDTPVTITLTGEVQGSVTPVFSITRPPLHGSLSALRVGSDTTDVVYTPNPDYNGADDFEFQISDGRNRSARGTVSINVTPVNDPPVAQPATVTTDEDQPVVITLTGSDPDGDSLTFGIASSPSAGTLGAITQVDATSAIVVYTPNADAHGSDEFTFVVNDGAVTSAAATVAIDVLPLNDAPVAAADLYTTLEDTPSIVAAPGLLANDADLDGDALTAIVVSAPATGTLVLDANGGFTYTPAANANGVVTFTYRANDGTADSDPVTVTINVTAVNDAPSFTKGADVTLLEDAGAQTLPWATALSAGPADEAAQALAFAVTANTNAALFAVPPAIAADGTLTFTTAADANGSATITVVLSDNGGTANGGVDTTAPQTFTITVTPVNDAPFFTKGADATVLEDSGAQTVDPWATALGAGPADESGQALAFAVTGNTNAALFLVQPAISPAGVLTFTPAADASGSATITLTLTDDGGTANGGADTSAAQTFVINVTEVNDAPSFTKGADAAVLEDAGAQTINGWATAISAGPAAEAGQTVVFNVVSNSNPALFSAQPAVSPSGVLTFTSAPDAFGTATITINAQDNGGTANGGIDTSATQSFVIDVTPVNDAPSATITPLHAVDEDSGPHTVATYVSAISPGPANEAGQTVTFSITGNTNAGLFVSGPAIDAAGTLTYSLNPDAFGTAAITVQLQDDGGTANGGIDTATLNFTIEVAAVNDAPVVTSGGPFTLAENSANGTLFGATVAATDVDPGQTLAFAITGGNTGGAFAINAATGVITVANSAALDFETTPSFTLTIAATDDGVPPLSGNQTFTINLTDVNEAPAVMATTFAVDENTANGTSVGTVAATDPDAGQTLVFAIIGGNTGGAFAINAATGEITVANSAALDFETTPSFSLTIQVTDNGVPALAGTAFITVNVNNVNEGPAFTSPSSASVPENTTAVMTVSTTDPEGDAITYSISGGTDAAFFSIDASTGALAFLAGRDFEAPADADANNIYLVEVTATDGTNPVVQSLSITVTDTDEPPAFTSPSTASVPENTTAVHTVTTIDAEGDTVTYSITGGADAALFSINSTTGVLAFNAAPDFEAPADADANNQYLVEVTATDGTTPVVQTITVTVVDVNEAPSFTSGAAPSVVENTTAVVIVTTTDPEGDTIAYSITGGADAALFAIDGATGALAFLSGPDFEAPADADTNNVYLVDVTATDGTNPVVQNLSVTVTDTNESPLFTSSATASTPENTTAVLTVTTTDAEGDTVTYSITGGADAALFSINPATGALAFNAAPDFEAPADADANNQYLVEVTATDGTTPVAQTITVTVTNVNEAPAITSTPAIGVPENTTAVVTVTATDPEGDTITYSISGGADAGFFTIDGSTGALSFLVAPDFETPLDAGTDNVYDVQVQATDATNNVTQDIAVTVAGTNEPPVITSPDVASVPENTTAVMTVTTTEPEGQLVSYSITGGADAALFSIVAATGVLTFSSAPDFEAPADSDSDNAYVVEITATDGTNPVAQTITVTVTDVDEAPSFTSSATPSVPENTTAVIDVDAIDPEGVSPTYSITGGADAALFSIDGTTGVLAFNAAPDFEAPADADTNNTYLVQVTATDGTNPVAQNLTVTVTNTNEAPSITSLATPSVPENTTAVITVTASDAEGDTITFSITGGVDQASFAIDAATGALSFIAPPDFEAPADADSNNGYLVQVTATDGTSPVVQNLTVTVTDVNEAPAFTSSATASVVENTTAVITVAATDPEGVVPAYSISGGADQLLFAINPATGELSFVAAPDFEAPSDSGANNVYDVIVTATDGTNSPTQAIAVTVTNANEAPAFTSTATPSVPENTTAVVTVTTSDPEGNTITYSITGGADAAFFAVNSATGALSFNVAPNFEAPADAGANNVYDVVVTATDGTNSPTQAIAVSVTNVNEAPVITSTNAVSVPENATAVLTVVAVDPEATAPAYSITGGADAADFAIDAATGALSFAVAPDFEAPADADTNNIYIVEVTATDGVTPVSQTITVTVTNVQEPPVFTSGATPMVPENTTAVVDVDASDAEGETITYSITGGADQARFAIVPATGVLSFLVAPNFEAPTDADANNTYLVEVTATTATGVAMQSLTVTVTNVNEEPTFTSPNTASVAENNTTVLTVTTTDPESDAITYTLTGGADVGEFAINATTGALTFSPAPNFESPADSDGDNIYVVQVTATDGTNIVNQTITVTVTNVNEAPTAVDDSYNALGNTTLQIAGSVAVPVTTVAKTGDVNAVPRTTGTIFNDTDPDLVPAFNTLSITFVTGNAGAVAVPAAGSVTTTTAHGSVTLHADGSFLYTPTAGYTGPDAFAYTISDGANSASGTVSITVVGPVVWYVKNNAPTPGNGTSASPYQLLSAAITASGAGHTIYVMAGDGTATNYGGSNAMKANQKLWGQAIDLDVTATNGVSLPDLIVATTRPLIGPAVGPALGTVTLGNGVTGVEVQGLSINGGALNAVDVTTSGANSAGLTFVNNIITAAGLEGIDVNAGGSGTTAISVQNSTITSTGVGFDLLRTAGTVTLAFSTNTVTSGGIGVNVAGGAAANTTITGFAGNTIHGNTVGSGVVMSNVTFDASTTTGGIQQVDGDNLFIGASGNSVGGAGLAITTSQGNLYFDDLDVYAAVGTALQATGTGSGLTFAVAPASPDGSGTSVLVAQNGAAVDIASAALDLRLSQLTSTTTGTAVNLSTVTGQFRAPSGSSISKTSGGGTAFNVANSNLTVTYAGSLNVTSGAGVSLTTNTGSTITFSGGMTLSTGTNAGFNATGGGTIAVCDENPCNAAATGALVNTITSTTGTALNVANTTIGANGLEFRSISASGAASGIILNNTGNSGSLMVKGNTTGNCGGAITLATAPAVHTVTAPTTGDCSGGTIQATTGPGISLTNTRSPSFTRMYILNSGTDGISANTVNGLTISNSYITDAAGGAGDRGIEIGDFATGTAVNGAITISNSTVGPTPHDNLGIGIASGTSTWSISQSVFTNSSLNSGINFEIRNATVSSWSLTNSVIRNQSADGMQMQPAANTNATITDALIQNTLFQSNNIGLDLNHDGTGSLTYRVLNSNFQSHQSHAVNVFSSAVQAPTTGGILNLRFENSSIGTAGTVNSGSAIGNGLRVNVNGGANGRMVINANTIRQTPNGRGIEIISRNGTGILNATVTNNNVQTNDTSGFPLADIFLQSNCLTVCNTLRSDVRGNTVNNGNSTDLQTGFLILQESGASTMELIDSPPASPSCAQQLNNTNTGSTSASAGCALIAGPILTPP